MYVDGFVLAVPEDRVGDYRKIAEDAAAVWIEHGALAYHECLADDVPYGELTSFPRAVQAKDGEQVVFAWITYPSREARDAVNARVMADPRMKLGQPDMPFDMKRMIFGGFRSLVSRERPS
ncbi:MAG: DUF1428 domain-containing protein [Myxococcota bacterium]